MSLSSRVLCCLLFVLTCLVPLAAGAHEHMGMAGMEGPALGAGAAFDAHGRLWLATTHRGHVLVQHSDDLGRTLSAPVEVNPEPEAIYATSENHPKIAIGPQGQVYVQWTQQPDADWTGFIRFARSTDGGRHFSAPITINHDLAKVTRGFDSLVVAGNGDIVSSWIDARDRVLAKAAGNPYRGFVVYYSGSADGGKTFAAERKLEDHSCECCRTTLAVTSRGDVAAFFRSIHGDNIRDHTYAVLSPTGQLVAPPERATFSNWQVAACPDQGPGLAIGANGIRHGVWYEAGHGPAIWYGQLDPGHPPRHALKIGQPGASHADVATHGRKVWVVWNQVNAEGYRLMARTSRDDGDHFGAPQVIANSAVAVYSPQLLVHDGDAYAAWNTASGFRLIKVPDAAEASP